MKTLLYLLLPLACLVCTAELSPAGEETTPISQAAAVAEIKKLGGTVQFDENGPGRPVVSVSVGQRAVTDDWLQNLKGLTSLQRLDLSHSQVTDAGLAHLKGLTELQMLILPPTRVTDAGLEQLQGLTNLQALSLGARVNRTGRERAQLKFDKSGEAVFVRLAGASGTEADDLRKLTKLQTLAVYGNFREAQLDALQNLKSLRVLQLNDARITDAGLKRLSGLTGLERLVLPAAQVTDAGLLSLKKLKNLQVLQLGPDQITAAGRKDFEAALPGCKMIVSVQAPAEETAAAKPAAPPRGATKLAPKKFVNKPADEDATPKNQYALELDGESSYLASEIRYDGTHSITVEAWVRPEDLTGHREVICNAQASGMVLGFYSGWCKFLVHDGQGYQQAGATRQVKAGEDLHVAGVFDGQQIALFINGVKQGAGTPFEGTHNPSSLPILIGANPEPNRFPIKQFAGVIDEVRISSTARYDADFKPQRRLTPDESTLALYHFDEGSGSVARDSSGNRSHARLDDARFVERQAADETYRPVPGTSAGPGPAGIEVPLTEWTEYAAPPIGNAGLERLKGLTNLRSLALTSSQVTGAGLVHLQDLASLQMLQLNGPQVTDVGLIPLARLTNLTFLDLNNTQITDDGLAHLKTLTNLRDLSLNGTQVTDPGLLHLKGLTSLRRLELQNTQVTPAGVRKLQQALPNCEILHAVQ